MLVIVMDPFMEGLCAIPLGQGLVGFLTGVSNPLFRDYVLDCNATFQSQVSLYGYVDAVIHLNAFLNGYFNA